MKMQPRTLAERERALLHTEINRTWTARCNACPWISHPTIHRSFALGAAQKHEEEVHPTGVSP